MKFCDINEYIKKLIIVKFCQKIQIRTNNFIVGKPEFASGPLGPKPSMLLLNTTSRNEFFCYLYSLYDSQILFIFKFLGVKSGRQESNLLPSRLQTACPYNQQTPTRYKNLSKPLLSIFLPVLFIRSILAP